MKTQQATQKMRVRHLYVCPRGFANETAIYRIETPEELAAAQRIIERYANSTDGRARFITRSEAEAHCRANRRAHREYRRAGMSNEIVGATEIVPAHMLIV